MTVRDTPVPLAYIYIYIYIYIYKPECVCARVRDTEHTASVPRRCVTVVWVLDVSCCVVYMLKRRCGVCGVVRCCCCECAAVPRVAWLRTNTYREYMRVHLRMSVYVC